MAGDLVVGVDVGGTSIKAALLDENLRGHGHRSAPTPCPARDPAAAVLDEVARVVDALRRDADGPVAAVGVAVPGIVDEDAGVARWSGNLGWRDVPLRRLLADRLPLPVAFGHDVRAGALAEATAGAARGYADAAFVPVGTGVSAALIVSGRLHAAGGYAGELGHVDVGTGVRCACGATGCLEAVASAPAIVRGYAERGGRGCDSAEQVAAAAAAGDPTALALLDDVRAALAAATTTLVTLFAPEVVVFGGGVFTAGATMLDPLARRVAERLTFQRVPALRLAELGSTAACVGAGILAREVIR